MIIKKIINPCVCIADDGHHAIDAFCEIIYDGGKLSISGVIGPQPKGDCLGSSGQCIDDIRKGTPVREWTRQMLDEFCDIWERWHNNDLRPYCKHQEKLGWNEVAKKKVFMYEYVITPEAFHKKRKAERDALEALRKGELFAPTREQVRYANMKHSLSSWNPKAPDGYKEKCKFEQRLGHLLYEKDHPDGLLGKPCPVCGYQYGSQWLQEEVPQDVLDFLNGLPESKTTPLWV